ncbi:MAG: hypothetical protein EOP84_27690 [Verrucomicrobiaceae bacterium]|nr:MAG: hypothetical protein EOP84_27690 [Verrucomicrobiaceae bacterium]
MKRYRWLSLVLIAVTSTVTLWKIFHSRSGREGMSSQAASRLERSPVGPVDPDVKLDPGPRRKARGNGEDRIRFRAREQALARIIEQIEALEIGRIFDRSRSVKDPIMTELLKNQYGLKNSKSPVIIEVHQLAVDVLTLEQA